MNNARRFGCGILQSVMSRLLPPQYKTTRIVYSKTTKTRPSFRVRTKKKKQRSVGRCYKSDQNRGRSPSSSQKHIVCFCLDSTNYSHTSNYLPGLGSYSCNVTISGTLNAGVLAQFSVCYCCYANMYVVFGSHNHAFPTALLPVCRYVALE